MSTSELLRQAQNLFNDRQFLQASKIYQEILKSDPTLARTGLSIHLAHSLILSGNWEEISARLIVRPQ